MSSYGEDLGRRNAQVGIRGAMARAGQPGGMSLGTAARHKLDFAQQEGKTLSYNDLTRDGLSPGRARRFFNSQFEAQGGGSVATTQQPERGVMQPQMSAADARQERIDALQSFLAAGRDPDGPGFNQTPNFGGASGLQLPYEQSLMGSLNTAQSWNDAAASNPQGASMRFSQFAPQSTSVFRDQGPSTMSTFSTTRRMSDGSPATTFGTSGIGDSSSTRVRNGGRSTRIGASNFGRANSMYNQITNNNSDYMAEGGTVPPPPPGPKHPAARGTDTVPAMLTPGEAVVSKKALQRNPRLRDAIMIANAEAGVESETRDGVVYAVGGFPSWADRSLGSLTNETPEQRSARAQARTQVEEGSGRAQSQARGSSAPKPSKMYNRPYQFTLKNMANTGWNVTKATARTLPRLANPFVMASGTLGYAAGTHIANPLINKGVQKLTGDEHATLGTAIYDRLHPYESGFTAPTPAPGPQQSPPSGIDRFTPTPEEQRNNDAAMAALGTPVPRQTGSSEEAWHPRTPEEFEAAMEEARARGRSNGNRMFGEELSPTDYNLRYGQKFADPNLRLDAESMVRSGSHATVGEPVDKPAGRTLRDATTSSMPRGEMIARGINPADVREVAPGAYYMGEMDAGRADSQKIPTYGDRTALAGGVGLAAPRKDQYAAEVERLGMTDDPLYRQHAAREAIKALGPQPAYSGQDQNAWLDKYLTIAQHFDDVSSQLATGVSYERGDRVRGDIARQNFTHELGPGGMQALGAENQRKAAEANQATAILPVAGEVAAQQLGNQSIALDNEGKNLEAAQAAKIKAKRLGTLGKAIEGMGLGTDDGIPDSNSPAGIFANRLLAQNPDLVDSGDTEAVITALRQMMLPKQMTRAGYLNDPTLADLNPDSVQWGTAEKVPWWKQIMTLDDGEYRARYLDESGKQRWGYWDPTSPEEETRYDLLVNDMRSLRDATR